MYASNSRSWQPPSRGGGHSRMKYLIGALLVVAVIVVYMSSGSSKSSTSSPKSLRPAPIEVERQAHESPADRRYKPQERPLPVHEPRIPVTERTPRVPIDANDGIIPAHDDGLDSTATPEPHHAATAAETSAEPEPLAVGTGATDNSQEPTNFGPPTDLNPPHGGELKDMIGSPEETAVLLKVISPSLPSLTLTQRQLCDIEMLLSGAFSPLEGFMDKATYLSVVEDLRLPTGEVWPMPITLDLDHDVAAQFKVNDKIALRDEFFNLIAIMTVTDKYVPEKWNEALKVFGTKDRTHPAVAYLFNTAGDVYLGGSLQGVRLPQHFDFNEIRFTPKQARARFKELGWGRFVGFQTRNPMHRAHIELTRLAAREIQGRVFINPVVGMTKPGDVDYATRVRCYQAVLKNSDRYYGKGGVFLGLLPLAMRMAGPREALWHAIIRKNYGASHFVVGRDHAGCKSGITGEDFYGKYDAQELVAKYKDEIGIQIVPFKALVYLPARDEYVPFDQVPEGAEQLSISGTKFRKMMADGKEIPAWFSDPGIIAILRQVNPPKPQRGFTVFFTGLSGSGKTTISHALIQRLTAINPARPITLLDGDVMRTHLSKGLGFSIPDRNANVARIGWVAAEITRQRGIAVACPIAPFEESRAAAREMVSATSGTFVLVHVATSLEECMKRDVKGLYKKALAKEIKLTGYSHPYENPDVVEITVDAGHVPVSASVEYIIGYLTRLGYLTESVSEEILDEHPEVVTAGKVDPSALLCTATTNNIVLGLGPFGSGLHSLREVAADADNFDVYTLSEATLAKVEGRKLAAPPAEKKVVVKPAAGKTTPKPAAPKTIIKKEEQREEEQKVEEPAKEEEEEKAAPKREEEPEEEEKEEVKTVAKPKAKARAVQDVEEEEPKTISLRRRLAGSPSLKKTDYDSEFGTGTPATTTLSSAQRLEAAWALFEGIRKPNSHVKVVTSPRLVVYAENLLRFDPCMKVAAFSSAQGDIVEAMARQGASAADAKAYAEKYVAAIEALKAAHPDRVHEFAGDHVVNDQDTISELKSFLGISTEKLRL